MPRYTCVHWTDATIVKKYIMPKYSSYSLKRKDKLHIYYPSEVRRGKYWGLGVLISMLQYFSLVIIRMCCLIIALT